MDLFIRESGIGLEECGQRRTNILREAELFCGMGEPGQCPPHSVQVCGLVCDILSCLVLQIISTSFATVIILSSWLLGGQMGGRMGPRRRNFVPSFRGHQNGDKGTATGNRENTFGESRKQSSGDPKLIIPQRNTGESLGGLPEWGFESTYPDLKELGSPRGHVDYTTEIQQSSFFG